MKDVTIAIPVYTAVSETIRCIKSILASDAKSCEIIVLDDGSPGGVQDIERAFAKKKNVTLISHFKNRGYTRNVNYALQSCKTKYFCLINSDVVVPAKWLGKLIEVASLGNVCAVGPLSNAASYQSIPEPFGGTNPQQSDEFGSDEAFLNELNAFVDGMFADRLIDMPILNGFCTVFNKDAVKEAGGFDYFAFPEGYGEENDVCVRLASLGYRLLLDPRVALYHEKSVSFGSDRKKVLSARGAAKLNEIYGDQLVPSLASVMKSSTKLNLIRMASRIFFDLKSDEKSTDVVTLEGGHSYKISSDGAEKLNAYDEQVLDIEFQSESTLELNLPKHLSLPVVSSMPLHSAVLGFAFESTERPVFYSFEENKGDQTEDWSWLIDVPFENLYLKKANEYQDEKL